MKGDLKQTSSCMWSSSLLPMMMTHSFVVVRRDPIHSSDLSAGKRERKSKELLFYTDTNKFI